MMILETLYRSMAHYQDYVSLLDVNADFKSLNASAASAVKQIKMVITSEIYATIVAIDDTTTPSEQKEALRTAVANLCQFKQVTSDTIKRRISGVDTFKNEQEQLARDFKQSYFDGMDSLIALLDKEGSAEWQATPHYQTLQKLQIKTTEEFDSIYPIDMSYLFFFRCIPWQKEALDERLGSMFSRAEGKESANALLKRALAKKTIAKALRRFDILEFPEVIRGLFKDSKVTRSGDGEQTRILQLADSLDKEADNLITDVDLSISIEDNPVDLVTDTNFNNHWDKVYMP
jgi:hypothetical protein